MKSSDWVMAEYTSKKKRLKYRHVKQEDHLRTQGKDNHLQAEETSEETNSITVLIRTKVCDNKETLNMQGCGVFF